MSTGHLGTAIPGSEKSLLIQTWNNLIYPFESLEKYRNSYGSIFRAQFLGFREFIVIGGSEAMEKIFSLPSDHFVIGSGSNTLLPLLGENSLVRLNGMAHQRQRKFLMPPFHGERLRSYGSMMISITLEVMRKIPYGSCFRMKDISQEITLRIILSTVFGVKDFRSEALRTKLSSMLNIFESTFGSSLLLLRFMQQDWGNWSPWGRFLNLRRQIDDLIYAEIQDRKGDPGGTDILSLMALIKDEEGNSMSDTELRDELMTLLFGGHETTASTLAWAFHWIYRSPQIFKNLMDELSTIGSDDDPNTISKLPYLSAVCSETMRISPVIPFGFFRKLVEPIEIMNYKIEPGALIIPCIYLVHHDTQLYPHPKQFRPERFLEREYSPNEFIPFGGGSRRCLGYAFALFELKLVLATILKETKLHLMNNKLDTAMRRGTTFTPSSGIPMKKLG